MTQPTRVELATTIHKAVRKLLFEQAMLLARTDPRHDDDVRHACDALDNTMLMLREHAEHEDVVVFPILAELDPSLASEAVRQHHALDGGMRDIERVAATLRMATRAERPRLGRDLSQRFNLFVAAQLQHLAFEEDEMQPAFWLGKTDVELLALRLTIRSLLPPERAQAWLQLMLSAADPAELAALAPPQSQPLSA